MSATRSTKEERAYARWRKGEPEESCIFCSIRPGHPQFVMENTHFMVVKNRFPYSIWDGQGVEDHLLIVPKLHVDSLSKLKVETATDFLQIISDYERQNYNPYARAAASTSKSILHQHTHLIKTDGRNKSVLFLIRWPFYLRASL